MKLCQNNSPSEVVLWLIKNIPISSSWTVQCSCSCSWQSNRYHHNVNHHWYHRQILNFKCMVLLVSYICYLNPRNILINCLIPSKHGAPTWVYGLALPATSVNHTDSSTEYSILFTTSWAKCKILELAMMTIYRISWYKAEHKCCNISVMWSIDVRKYKLVYVL